MPDSSCAYPQGCTAPTVPGRLVCADHAAKYDDAHEPPATAAWDAAKHNAEYGHCAKCGADLIESFGADGPVIVSAGWCNACGVTTVWSVTDAT